MNRLLLDTHTLLWWLSDNQRLGNKTRAIIKDGHNQVFVSAASVWEISIKQSMGKLTAPDDIDGITESEGFEKLPISLFHGQQAGRLPAIHRDPFDRMLIAQAQAEGLLLITADRIIPQYGITTFDANS